jgi:hypothetical protein
MVDLNKVIKEEMGGSSDATMYKWIELNDKKTSLEEELKNNPDKRDSIMNQIKMIDSQLDEIRNNKKIILDRALRQGISPEGE